MYWDQTMFAKVSSCVDFFESDAFWATCGTTAPSNLDTSSTIYCGGGKDFNRGGFNALATHPAGVFGDGTGPLTSSDVETIVAAMRARPAFMSTLKTRACSLWPFPPYACSRRTTEKTFVSVR